jgi:NTP pyrophosphatase (non-canonical NTP hydrolase)
MMHPYQEERSVPVYNDCMITIANLTNRILAFRDERDWLQFHTPKDMAAAIAIEAAELQELFLWKSDQEQKEIVEGKRERLGEELADIAMYLFELSHNLGFDLGLLIEDKLSKNAVKYPVALSKGSSKKYDEL